ncbi:MAG: dephospho-CoA kinase [Oscillospiraceae bacterium]|nr:dephospho-CoA kinase [Oscillospiraceae bacterium]
MNSLDGVMVVGLTGQTGSGKTTVCKLFEENDFAIINADDVAHNIVKPGSVCLREIADCFGTQIIRDDDSLDRKKLAQLVFNDSKKLELLDSITYPYITSEILRMIRFNSSMGKKLILLDAPTLFESRADDFCEIIISVISDEDIRIGRIMNRDLLTESEARSRINSQHSEKFFIDNSDFIIKNDNDIDSLNEIVRELSDKIKKYYNDKFKDTE